MFDSRFHGGVEHIRIVTVLERLGAHDTAKVLIEILTPLVVILPLMLPAVLPFNLIKTVLNSVLTLAVYKAVSNLITPKKDQVKGRA